MFVFFGKVDRSAAFPGFCHVPEGYDPRSLFDGVGKGFFGVGKGRREAASGKMSLCGVKRDRAALFKGSPVAFVGSKDAPYFATLTARVSRITITRT